MSHRAVICWIIAVLACSACGDDDDVSNDAGHSGHSDHDAGAKSGAGGQTGGGAGGRSGRSGSSGSSGSGGRASPLSCTRDKVEVQCGGQTCPSTTETEQNPCSVPCCVTLDGAERCGFRGTARGFTTECVLPAVPDPTCDEVPQFEGCCEPTQHVCGIIGGFAPGCTTKSNFVTLPKSPKKCGSPPSDGGAVDQDGGS